MIPLIGVVLLFFLATYASEVKEEDEFRNLTCNYRKKNNQVEAFYINLDRSAYRKKNIEKHLTEQGLKFHRVPAYSLKEFTIPSDILHAIENPPKTGVCITKTEEDPEDHESKYFVAGNNRKVYVRGVCGKYGNSVKELITVASHLLAIEQAVYSKTAVGKYALIVEDDVWTPFDIDYEELIESLPTASWGMVQLFNSKPVAMYEYYERYKRFNMIWHERVPAHDARFLPTFSTGAYLINREVMKPIIDQIIYNTKNGWKGYTIVAATNVPICRPALCCESGKFEASLPFCTWAPVGLHADSFLYALTKTYVFALPLYLDGSGSEDSTIHQMHVVYLHRNAFQKMRGVAIQFLKEELKLPHFIKPACRPKNLSLPNVRE